MFIFVLTKDTDQQIRRNKLSVTWHERFNLLPDRDRWLIPGLGMFDVFYIPQTTSSNCTVTVATMTVNALRGLESNISIPTFDQTLLLDAVGSRSWIEKTVEDGAGTTFSEFAGYLRRSLDAAGHADARIAVGKPKRRDRTSLARLRAALKTTGAKPDRLMVVVYNQGVIAGNWNGPHASAIGAYDAAEDRVLIMDVDRARHAPYWTSTARLHAAMLKPAPLDQGRLAGDTGGYITVRRN